MRFHTATRRSSITAQKTSYLSSRGITIHCGGPLPPCQTFPDLPNMLFAGTSLKELDAPSMEGNVPTLGAQKKQRCGTS